MRCQAVLPRRKRRWRRRRRNQRAVPCQLPERKRRRWPARCSDSGVWMQGEGTGRGRGATAGHPARRSCGVTCSGQALTNHFNIVSPASRAPPLPPTPPPATALALTAAPASTAATASDAASASVPASNDATATRGVEAAVAVHLPPLAQADFDRLVLQASPGARAHGHSCARCTNARVLSPRGLRISLCRLPRRLPLQIAHARTRSPRVSAPLLRVPRFCACR